MKMTNKRHENVKSLKEKRGSKHTSQYYYYHFGQLDLPYVQDGRVSKIHTLENVHRVLVEVIFDMYQYYEAEIRNNDDSIKKKLKELEFMLAEFLIKKTTIDKFITQPWLSPLPQLKFFTQV